MGIVLLPYLLMMVFATPIYSQELSDTLQVFVLKQTESKFIWFTARYVEGTTYLNWTVQGEKDNGLFFIERSADSTHFETIGYRDCVGVPIEQPILYSWQDTLPVSDNAWYRVMKIDLVYWYKSTVVRTVTKATCLPSSGKSSTMRREKEL